MATKVKDVTVQVRMSTEMKRRADVLADRDGMTLSAFLRHVLARKIYLDSRRGL